MLEDIFQSLTSVSLFGAFIALFVFHLLYSNLNFQEKRDPPGPIRVPVLGNLLQIDLNRLDQSLFDLSKKYGSVFQVYFGPQKVVVLAGYRTVKQAMVNHADEFGNREITPLFYDLNQGHGVLFSNGDSWKEMRRFALTTLRDIGMGRKMSEETIIAESGYLKKEFEQFEGEAFDTLAINYASANVISALLFGKRFEYNDQILQNIVQIDRENIHLTGSASVMIYNLYPWLGPFCQNWKDLMKNNENGVADLRMLIADLKETFDPKVCRCFVDAFLIRKQYLKDDVRNSHYHDDNLLHTVDNLLTAGTDTTAVTLTWCLLYMAKFLHIQDRVQEELSRVIGSRQIRTEDRKDLPYTDAVIHESQRFANIAPTALPHRTTKDLTFQGYVIKEGTTVVPLLTSVLYDESEWESPYTFNPFHFLNKEGKFIRRDAFMAFNGGRRACLGESLARMELFLFFTSLLQHFRFTPPPGVSVDEVDLDPLVGLTLAPKPQQFCAVRRL
ncbi:cytochrome P450 2K1 [Nematolebias whitei]|uniref:cytochrome P450 2K1 n=1 Tax=Nematolebias whitei TaxID=451745 RepID=UPI00189748A3|nr:cytochrome P450 2K1 [Nematolebias whitei]